MNELSPELTEAILAVDALNPWVRSESYRRQHVSSPKHAVYWLKRCALKAASDAGCAYSRVVATIAECHRCNGSGRYVNWDGHDCGPCRRCASSGEVGSVILYFVETHIYGHGGFLELCCWHSPTESFPLPRPEGLPGETSWRPNTVGKDLRPSEVAHFLNVAETAFTERPGKRYVVDCAPVDDFAYKLYVGETSADICSICRSQPPKVGSFCVSRGPIGWKDHACAACDALYHRSQGRPDIFDAFPVPHELLQDANIRAWIERRGTEHLTALGLEGGAA